MSTEIAIGLAIAILGANALTIILIIYNVNMVQHSVELWKREIDTRLVWQKELLKCLTLGIIEKNVLTDKREKAAKLAIKE